LPRSAGRGAPARAKTPAQIGLRDQPLDRVRQGRRIAGRDQEAGAAVLDRLGGAGTAGGDDRGALGHRLEDYAREALSVAVAGDDAGDAECGGAAHPAAHVGMRQPAEQRHAVEVAALLAQRAGERAVADQQQPRPRAARGKEAHRLDQESHPLFLDKAADEQQVGIARGEDVVGRRVVDIDPLVDDFELALWKAARQQLVADELGDADEEGRLALQRPEAAGVGVRQQTAAVMRLLAGVGAVEGHDQRDAERPGDRQRHCAAGAEMRLHEARPQATQIGLRRQQAEMAEQRTIDEACRPRPAEAQRGVAERGCARLDVIAEPDRAEMLEPEIEAAEKPDLGLRRQPVTVDEDVFSRAGVLLFRPHPNPPPLAGEGAIGGRGREGRLDPLAHSISAS
jgi:hypothetical protein